MKLWGGWCRGSIAILFQFRFLSFRFGTRLSFHLLFGFRAAFYLPSARGRWQARPGSSQPREREIAKDFIIPSLPLNRSGWSRLIFILFLMFAIFDFQRFQLDTIANKSFLLILSIAQIFLAFRLYRCPPNIRCEVNFRTTPMALAKRMAQMS